MRPWPPGSTLFAVTEMVGSGFALVRAVEGATGPATRYRRLRGGVNPGECFRRLLTVRNGARAVAASGGMLSAVGNNHALPGNGRTWPVDGWSPVTGWPLDALDEETSSR